MENKRTYTIYAKDQISPKLFIRKGIYEPKEYIFKEIVTCNPLDINKFAEEIFKDKFKENYDIVVGNVVIHSDGFKNHHGVVIEIKDNNALVIICTTNDKWNKKSRLATKEELQLFNFNNETYLAPIIRPIRELFNMNYSFPKFRISSLIKEFGSYDDNVS